MHKEENGEMTEKALYSLLLHLVHKKEMDTEVFIIKALILFI